MRAVTVLCKTKGTEKPVKWILHNRTFIPYPQPSLISLVTKPLSENPVFFRYGSPENHLKFVKPTVYCVTALPTVSYTVA